RHGRHDLPWQHPRTPYRVWLSEIMLQQTQVSVVIPYFERFVAALPDVPALASAPADQVLALWSGLGYYSRARNLHAAARRCVEEHEGALPRDLAALMVLPGIGRSTAGAILSQAWGDAAPILDGNVKRVLARLHGIEGWPGAPAVERQLWAIAEAALPDSRLADYTQAQMDFGATLCTRHNPACGICPLREDCRALADGTVDVLPSRKPAKALPQRQACVVMLEADDGRILLQRRPPTGVWASLWSLPQFDDAPAAEAWLLQQGFAGNPLQLPPIEHGFSHYRLTMQPLHARLAGAATRVGDNDDLRWIRRDELAALGIPAPIRKLLEAIT
ncbi:MAG: A/G-specific adenine glycosylase, partial [Pseudoxanthomonas suwonensis]|nr:A/G-specific adenine glycosylase [Pseudoxanthomonas suwonensis]